MMKRRFLSWLLMALMVLTTVITTDVAFAAPSPQMIQGELIVAVSSQTSSYARMGASTEQHHKDVFSTGGFQIKSGLHEMPGQELRYSVQQETFKRDVINAMGYVYLVDYSESYASFNQAKKALEKSLKDQGISVKYIEPNYRLHATGDMNASMHNSQQWHYNMIKAPEAWTVNQGNSAVKIAVLDTGIDHNHPSLRNFVNLSLAKNFTSGSASDTMDRQGHGTHVAGTIASYGVVSGVMKSATLIPVKVLGDDGSGSLYGIEQGILYASEIGADVINMSLGGGGYAQSMADACRTAYQRGTVVVAATGNDGAGTVSYPAAYDYVIGVGSVTENRTRSSFSNYGTGLDVMAPGSNIYSTYPGSQYKTLSGTSMATPHVSGVCGLIKATNPQLTPQRVEEILKSTAQYAGSSNQYGSGIVDAYKSVQAAGGTTPVEKVLMVTLNLDATNVNRQDTVTATATVKDQAGALVNGATVAWTLKRPDGTTASASGTTNNAGVATVAYTVTANDAYGIYEFDVNVSLNGYESASAQKTFTVMNTENVTVTGYSYSNVKRYTTNYWFYKLYNTSASVYVNLSDGTRYLHGTVSASSWYGYPRIQKTITGNATANSTGQKVPYNIVVDIAPN